MAEKVPHLIIAITGLHCRSPDSGLKKATEALVLTKFWDVITFQYE